MLEQIWDISPVLFALVVFVLAALLLKRLGVLSFNSTKDPEDKKLDELYGEVYKLKDKIQDLDKNISILMDRWDRDR